MTIATTGRQPQRLHLALGNATRASVIGPRPPKKWASSLPLCPKAFWIDANHHPRHDTSSFQADLRMNKGTAVHQALQNALARTHYLFGHWKCARCGTAFGRYQHVTRWSFQPEPCPLHGPLVYEEIRLEVDGISGRVDGIVSVVPSRIDEGVTIVEWKTTTNLPDEPKPQHCEQVNFYACALEQVLPIVSVVVQYRHTEQPNRFVSFEVKPNHEHFQTQLNTSRYISENINAEEPLWGLCDRGGDPYYCGYQDYCQRTR